MYCPYGNIISFFHARVKYISFKHTPLKPLGHMGGKQPQHSPLPLQHVDPHLIRQCLGRPHSPIQTTTTQRSPHCLQWDTQFTSKPAPSPLDDHHPHLIHPSLDRSYSPSQTASRSIQPFCHSTLSTLTDTHRPTYGLGDGSVRILRALAIMMETR